MFATSLISLKPFRSNSVLSYKSADSTKRSFIQTDQISQTVSPTRWSLAKASFLLFILSFSLSLIHLHLLFSYPLLLTLYPSSLSLIPHIHPIYITSISSSPTYVIFHTVFFSILSLLTFYPRFYPAHVSIPSRFRKIIL